MMNFASFLFISGFIICFNLSHACQQFQKLTGLGFLTHKKKKWWLYYFHVLIVSFFYSNCLNIPTVSLTRLEVSIYFSVDFFFFTQLFFKNISIILSILHGILLKYCSSKNISLKFYFFINFLLLSNRLSLYL